MMKKIQTSTMAKKLFLAILFSVPLLATAQTQQEYIRMQEQIRRSHVTRQLDSGVVLMETGRYDLAEEKFLYALNNSRSVPSDLTFYFGKNSYYLNKYKQSVDWLNKYLQLKGTNGQFSEEAATLLQKAQAGFLRQRSQDEVKKSTEVLSTNYDIDCGPSGKVTCPVCKGDHVIVKKATFGDEYKTCPYCDEHGTLSCEQYNTLLRGQLKPKS